MAISKDIRSTPFDFQVKLATKSMASQFYSPVFTTPKSYFGVIKGLQVICQEMVVYIDNTPAFFGWQFDFINGVTIKPYVGGNPLATALRKSTQPVSYVEILPSDGFGFPNQLEYAYNIEVPQGQEFGLLFTPTATPWINNAGKADLVLRAYGHFYNKADWKE